MEGVDGSTGKEWGWLESLNQVHPNAMLEGKEVLLGRHSQALKTLRFEKDNLISSRHAVFSRTADGAMKVTDGSVNGVFVNGVKVGKGKSVELAHGDEVSIAVASAAAAVKQARWKDTFISYRIHQGQRVPRETSKRAAGSKDPDSAPAAKKSRNDAGPATSTTTTTATTTAVAATTVIAPASVSNGSPGKTTALPPVAPPVGTTTTTTTTAATAAAAQNDKDEAMEESMSCHICSEILYKVVTLLPCLHNFCSACYSDWMARSHTCPECRTDVDSIRRNHALNNVVETYLKAHPDKVRDEEDLKDMDERNKITDESLRLQSKKKKRKYDSDEDDYDSYDSGGSDSEDDDVCPECTTAGADGFKCGAVKSHLNCSACYKKYANRGRVDGVAPQRCDICLMPYCGLYRRCTANAAAARFAKGRDVNWITALPDTSFNRNKYEQTVVSDWAVAQGKTIPQVATEVFEGVDNGTFKITTPFKLDTAVCANCANRVFSEGLYDLRAAIPNADLPPAVTARPDCHWGKNCRTQVKPHHAAKFNHICDQTRF